MKSMLIVLLFALAAVESRQDHWYASDTDTTCVIVDSDASGSIMVNNTAVPFVFADATFEGTCSDSVKTNLSNKLDVFFYPEPITGAKPVLPWKLELVFVKYDEENYRLDNWTLTTNNVSKKFPLAEEYTRKGNSSDLSAPILKGFQCTSVELSFQGDNSVKFSDIKAMAFGKLTVKEFPKDFTCNTCDKDRKTSAIVPIVVGCFLGGLVVAVLVAYMIGRRRARTQGYASV